MKNVIISGYIGFNNFGDDAIFDVLVNYLKTKNLNINAISKTPDLTEKLYNINSTSNTDFLNIIKGIFKSDILISGGGSLLQNQTSNKSLIYYLLIILIAKILNKKVVIFAQGLEGIKGTFFQNLTRKILKMCDFITVRSEKSKEFLKNIKCTLVSDPFYSIKLNKKEEKDIIGIQIRNFKNLPPDFLSNFAFELTKKHKNAHFKLFILDEKYDKNLTLKLKENILNYDKEAKVEIIEYQNFKQTISDFCDLKKLYAMRYHAILLAIKYGIDVVAINYDKKVEDLSYEYNLNLIDCNNIKLDDNLKMKNIQKEFDFKIYDFLFDE